VDYNALTKGIEASDKHSAIAESQSPNSYIEKKAFTYMAETSKMVAKRFEEQTWVQKEQQEMLWVQQESINDLKVVITQLLTNWKKILKGPKPNASSSKSKGK